MDKQKRYYVAYGSNLHMGQMVYRCPGALAVGTAWIPDYRLMYKGSKTGAYLTIEKCPGARVPVAIWEVTKQDEANLDWYEGCPTFYYKKEMPLKVSFFPEDRVQVVDCFVYIMHEERAFGIPRKCYIDTCKEGYWEFGFNPKYLDEALQYTRKEVNKYEERKREHCRAKGLPFLR